MKRVGTLRPSLASRVTVQGILFVADEHNVDRVEAAAATLERWHPHEVLWASQDEDFTLRIAISSAVH